MSGAGPSARRRGFFARTFASLGHPQYRRFFTGLSLTMIGFWMRIATVGWLIYDLTGSAGQLGVVTLAGLLPWIVTSPLGGTIADRVDERRMLALLQAMLVLLNVLLGVLVLFGLASVPLIIAFTFVGGCVRGFEHPARHSLVKHVVGTEGLSNAIGLNAACFQFSSAIGPVIAGLLYGLVGPGPCFICVGLFACPFVWILPRLVLEPRAPRTRGGSTRQQLWEGFGYVWQHQLTRYLMLGAALTSVFLWSSRTLLPAVAKDGLGLDATGYGQLMSAIGVGALAGALWLAGRGTGGGKPIVRQLLFVVVGCAAISGMALSHSVWLTVACLVATGFANTAFLATANARIQETVPDALRARVMGVWALLFGLSFPVGSLLMGFAADLLGLVAGIHAGVVLTAFFTLLAAPLMWRAQPLSDRVWLRKAPTDEGTPSLEYPGGPP